MTVKQIPWTRFGFESILIVSSILVALAVDSWWEYRNERKIEQQVLDTLLSEFARNKSEHSRIVESLGSARNAARQLLMFVGKDLVDEDADVIDQSYDGLYSYHTFDPSSGALDS